MRPEDSLKNQMEIYLKEGINFKIKRENASYSSLNRNETLPFLILLQRKKLSSFSYADRQKKS